MRLALVLFLLAASPALAQRAVAPGLEHSPRVEIYARNFIAEWARDPQLHAALRASTDSHRKLAWNEARALDQRWRNELADRTTDGLVDAVMTNPLSDFLRDKMAAAPNGAVTEIYITDGLGWNTAATEPPADFFQGDELQWQNVLPASPRAVTVSELEDNRGKGRTLAIVSLPIVDGQSNIGVVTLGVDTSKLP